MSAPAVPASKNFPIMPIAMTYPPWFSKAYAKPIDPERGFRGSVVSTGVVRVR
jgi:hypothetical protein